MKNKIQLLHLFEFIKLKTSRKLPLYICLVHFPNKIKDAELNVEGSLIVEDEHEDIHFKLPDNLKVAQSLMFQSTNLQLLGYNTYIVGMCDISNTKVHNLPNKLVVNGILVIVNTYINELPDDLIVNKDDLESFRKRYKTFKFA